MFSRKDFARRDRASRMKFKRATFKRIKPAVSDSVPVSAMPANPASAPPSGA